MPFNTPDQPLRVTVWHEFRHEHTHPVVQKVYPDGMHTVKKAAIEEQTAAHFGRPVEVRTATLDQDGEHGLSDEVLANTDVMTWWGHCAHGDVRDDIAAKVRQRVLEGMGLVVLHSGHYSKPFTGLLGTGGHLKWREAGEKERLWVMRQGHPLTAGMTSDHILIPQTEMYGEPFDIPEPDELVFVSWFEGGEVFRSGCVFNRGAGRIVYLRPGHETFPIYYQPEIRRLLTNAVHYAAPDGRALAYRTDSPMIGDPLEPIASDHEIDEHFKNVQGGPA